MIRLCFHGAESTGKSTLAAKLSAELDLPWVPEFGRAYAEQHGTDFSMADLLAIARNQDAEMQSAAALCPPLLLLDTDPLMTAAWAQMLFGTVPDQLLGYQKAEHYLLFSADTPWQEDGTRLFGSSLQRARFAAICEEVLIHVAVPYSRIAGNWAERESAVRAALAGLPSQTGS
jgi:NadR type nicotinamide-nucleotide adenylyltransferase